MIYYDDQLKLIYEEHNICTIIKLCLDLTDIHLLIALANFSFHFDFEKSVHSSIN